MFNLYDALEIAKKYILYLKKHNFEFDDNGFPVFTEDMFLNEIPELIVPYSNRNSKCI